MIGGGDSQQPSPGHDRGVAPDVAPLVFVCADPAVDADVPVVPGRVVAGVGQGRVGQLEEDPLLRVAQLGLPRADPEERRVEVLDVVEHLSSRHEPGIVDLVRRHPQGELLLARGEPH